MKLTGALLILGLAATLSAADKVTVEEIIAKHRASIGTPEALAAVKTRLAAGKSQMKFVQGGTGTLDGRAFALGEGTKFRIAMPFTTNPSYWGEQILFDGSKVTIGFSQPGQRSPLGNLLNRFDAVLKEGLMGGILNPAWSLLTLEERQPKLTYKGIKNIDGRDLHLVGYHMKKGQDLEIITLYFDPETFRHVRTSYEVSVSSPMISKRNEGGQQVEGHIAVEEIFSEFTAVDGLKLPMHWTVRTNITGNNTSIREWAMVFEQILHNQPIDPKTWVIDQGPAK